VTSGRLTYVGHSTVLIELDGFRVLTDPVLRSRLVHLRRVVTPVSSELVGNVDAVLVSHAHWDHLDVPSLERVGRSVPIVVPRGVGKLLRRKQFAEVIEMAADEQVPVGPLRIEATHAEHGGTRGPLGVRGAALGYVVSGSRRVYFAGDTDLFDGMSALGERLDVALLPVWGWGRKLGPGHLDPKTAAEALLLLRPRLAIPIHWGTLRPLIRVRGSRPRPAEEFRDLAAELAPETDVRVLPPGNTLALE
jgi:L-ascorbate metabolism protein UlaG (beta-lactamase superfamily)